MSKIFSGIKFVFVWCGVIFIPQTAEAQGNSTVRMFGSVGNWQVIQAANECQAAVGDRQKNILFLRKDRGQRDFEIRYNAPTKLQANVAHQIFVNTSSPALEPRKGLWYNFVTIQGPSEVFFVSKIGQPLIDEMKSSLFIYFQERGGEGLAFNIDGFPRAFEMLNRCLAGN